MFNQNLVVKKLLNKLGICSVAAVVLFSFLPAAISGQCLPGNIQNPEDDDDLSVVTLMSDGRPNAAQNDDIPTAVDLPNIFPEIVNPPDIPLPPHIVDHIVGYINPFLMNQQALGVYAGGGRPYLPYPYADALAPAIPHFSINTLRALSELPPQTRERLQTVYKKMLTIHGASPNLLRDLRLRPVPTMPIPTT